MGARNNGTGAAYIFHKNAITGVWQQQQILFPVAGQVADEFGNAVIIQGNSVFISAPKNDENGTNSGAVYVFDFNASTQLWEESQKLMASNGNNNDEFGTSLSVSDDFLFIGAAKNDTLGNNSGLVYIFRYNIPTQTWKEYQRIAPSDGGIADEFGWTLSVDGDKAVIGAPVNSSDGACYFYAYMSPGTWMQMQKIEASDGYSGDKFGCSVGLSDNNLIVGAYKEDANGASSGAAYRYSFSMGSFSNEQKILASDGSEGDEFGGSVAMYDETLLIGAAKNDDLGNSSGSAYLIENLTVSTQLVEVSDIKLVPNPCSNYLQIHLPYHYTCGTIEIFNLSGNLLLMDKIHSGKNLIDVSTYHLAFTTYLL